MRKISKITLENFRGYLGIKEIDFNNSNNEPADFVCIYGKNGFGKTSLFDGFEWFFTGEIYLLGEELKDNVSRYKGNVLKNKYACDSDRAGIGIVYSDGSKGHRTVVKKHNSINDYGKGRGSGEYKDLLNKKQILPHSKIDSFVYANSPENMFTEWGNFWDPDNKQRNLFKSIFKVYKEITDKTKECDEQLRELLNDLSTLNIEMRVEEFNLLIGEYNEMVIRGSEKIEPLKYVDNKKIDFDIILAIEKKVEPLTSYISSCKYISEQCHYLEKYYNHYKQYEKNEEELYYRKKRWKSIIKKCEEKSELLEKKEKLSFKTNVMLKTRDDLLKLFDEKWFDKYCAYIELKTKYAKISANIQNSELKKKNLFNKVEIINDEIYSLTINLRVLGEHYIKWKASFQELLIQEKSILDVDKKNELYKKKEDNKNKIKLYKDVQRYLSKASGGDYLKFVDSLGKEEKLKYHGIVQFYDGLKKVKAVVTNCKNSENELKSKYQNMKSDVDSLDELLTLAKREILKKNLDTCPICKSEFTNVEELLQRIDFSIQREMLETIKTKWDICKDNLKKAEEDYEKACNEIKEKLESMIYTTQQKIIDCENEIKKCNDELQEKEKRLNEIEDKKADLRIEICRNTGADSIDLSESCIDTVYQKKVTEIKVKIEEYNKKINDEKKEINKLIKDIETENKALEELEKSKNDFLGDENNQKKLEVLEQRKLFSYSDFLSVINEYNNEIKTNISKLRTVEELLKQYKIYRSQNVDNYTLHLKNLDSKSEEWIDTYKEYKNNVFKKNVIALKTVIKFKNELDSKIDLAQKKLQILNRCLHDYTIKETIKNYNCLIADKIKKQKERDFESCKAKIAEQILSSAKKQLENHIKNVFGGITISHIYEKIEPHKRFKKLEYQIGFNDNEKPELYVKVLNNEEEGVTPELFFSSAQLNTVALSVFLGGALSSTDPQIKTIFIDDPIGHFDDLNVLSFIDVLRTIVSETDWQIIISTHEENFYDIMKVKLNPEYYNSKFLVFEDEGTVVEDTRK